MRRYGLGGGHRGVIRLPKPCGQVAITFAGDKAVALLMKQNGDKVNDLDGRVALVEDLPPWGTIELPLTITAPNEAGIYILQLDAIQESVAWFGDRGSEVLSLKIRVE